MITITRKGLQLAINDEIIPAQGSSDVPIRFINDNETYQNYLIEPRVGWFKDGYPKSTVAKYEKGIIYLPAEVFIKNGPIAIVIALIDPQNSNHIEVTQSVISAIANAPLGDIILPEKETWEQAVTSLVKQLNEQIQADVAAAIKKANKASEDATVALTKSNQTNQTINEKIEDGSFVPQATAGTVEMTQPGTKAEVTITGDKKNPEFNFKIPKDEIDDSEDIKKALLQGTYTTDLSEEYKGVASDYGAEILKIEGKSEQVTTNGYQLFDASKLQTKTQGGATVTNNGDGSFTVSGNGSLNDNCRLHKSISNIKASDYFKVGKVTFNADGITYPRVFFQLWEDGVENLFNIDLNGKTSGSVEITQDMLNRGNKIEFGIVGSTNQPIKAGTIKPMLYQEGDGTWEPFTGGMPSPNTSYPQEINNALDEPLISIGRNLANPQKAFPNGSTSINGVSFKLNDNGTITLNGTSSNLIDMYYYNNDAFVLNLPNGTYLLWNNLELENYFRITGNIYIKNKTEVTNNNKIYTPFVRIPKGKTFNNDILEVMFEQSEEKTKFTPCNYAETSLDLSEPLRSLNDGTYDVYDNGTIIRITDYKEYDGSSDEAWKLQSINSNGIANFNIGISSSNQVAGSMCNRFIFDRNSIAQATKEGYHLNDNNFFIRLKKETASTVEQLKEWLKEHPVRLLFERNTPITEKVELPIVPTFYPYTNIFQSDDVKARIQYGLRSKVEECPYDIGDLYITLNEILPSVKWKGTKWERVEGLVPVGYKESDADFGTLGKTGGAKTVTLTEEQMPDHNHPAKTKKAGNHDHKLALGTPGSGAASHTGARIKADSWTTSSEGENIRVWQDAAPILDNGEHDHIITVENAGGSQAHNNLQPYEVFNMWLRTK